MTAFSPKVTKRGAKPDLTKPVKTGSTLLDLAISGNVTEWGGLPRGIFVEIFGESGLGKTGLVVEICRNAELLGGDFFINDPEGRLNKAYASLYSGLEIPNEKYDTVKTVFDSFELIKSWKPKVEEGAPCIFVQDSLASLTTDLEMDSRDKMGMRRAKEFSEQMRRYAVEIGNSDKIVVMTNQVRVGDKGKFTPGGKAIPFYSSIRIELIPYGATGAGRKNELTKDIETEAGKKITRVFGTSALAKVVKSSVDDPYRTAPVHIVFGYGIDDIRANLQWYKDMTGGTKYECGPDKSYIAMEQAIKYVEENSTEDFVKDNVKRVWKEFYKPMERKKKYG